jgi:hypothetical protein
MCKKFGKLVDKLRIILGNHLFVLVEKIGVFITAWKTNLSSTIFYSPFSHTARPFRLLYFLTLSTISTSHTATTKLKKGIV